MAEEVVLAESDQRRLENDRRASDRRPGSAPPGPRRRGRSPRYGRATSAGPRRRPYAPRLQRTDHRLEEGVAAADEDHHVARPDRRGSPVFSPTTRSRESFWIHRLIMSAIRPARIPADHRLRTRRAASANPRGRAASPRRWSATARRRPSSGADRFVNGVRLAAAATPRHAASRLESLVDGCENGRGRAKGEIERHGLERKLRVTMALVEEAPHLRELLRRRALEGEDRLLLVADGEDGPPGGTRARAGEELRRQGGDDAPLLGRGVLRFVDEQVVEPVIELPQYPGGAGALDEGRALARSDRRSRARRARPWPARIPSGSQWRPRTGPRCVRRSAPRAACREAQSVVPVRDEGHPPGWESRHAAPEWSDGPSRRRAAPPLRLW